MIAFSYDLTILLLINGVILSGSFSVYKISRLPALFLVGTIFCNMSASESPTWREKACILTNLFGRCVVGQAEFAYRPVAEPIDRGVAATQKFVADHPKLVTAAAGTVGLVAMAAYSEREVLKAAGAGPADSRGIVRALFTHPKAYVVGGLAAGTALVTSKEQKEIIIDNDLVVAKSQEAAIVREVRSEFADLKHQFAEASSQSGQCLGAIQKAESVVDTQALGIAVLREEQQVALKIAQDTAHRLEVVAQHAQSLEDAVSSAATYGAAEIEKTRKLQAEAGDQVRKAFHWLNPAAKNSRKLSKSALESNAAIRDFSLQIDTISASAVEVQGAVGKMQKDLLEAQVLAQASLMAIRSLAGPGTTGETE